MPRHEFPSSVSARLDDQRERREGRQAIHARRIETARPDAERSAAFRDIRRQRRSASRSKAWLLKTAKELGFVARDAGKVTEIELPASTPNAPILGLIV